MPICGSPKLFAAYRVLRRQSVPLASTLRSCSLDLSSPAGLSARACALASVRGSGFRVAGFCSPPLPPKTFLEQQERFLIVLFLFSLFPVQFSRCAEGLTLRPDPSKRYRKILWYKYLSDHLCRAPAAQDFLAGLAGASRLCSLFRPWDVKVSRLLCSARFPSAFASVPRSLPFSSRPSLLPRKEVIQPHLPIRLPCYDFTPVIGLTFGSCPLR